MSLFNSLQTFDLGEGRKGKFFSLPALEAAGVGKIDRQSPIMTTKVIDINFNPFWTVPVSIIRKDLIPKMQANPNYLIENKIRIFTKEGNEIQSTQVNWKTDEATRYIDLDRLAISPQCGFASTVAGNPLTEDDERAKVALVVNAASSIWS